MTDFFENFSFAQVAFMAIAAVALFVMVKALDKISEFLRGRKESRARGPFASEAKHRAADMDIRPVNKLDALSVWESHQSDEVRSSVIVAGGDYSIKRILDRQALNLSGQSIDRVIEAAQHFNFPQDLEASWRKKAEGFLSDLLEQSSNVVGGIEAGIAPQSSDRPSFLAEHPIPDRNALFLLSLDAEDWTTIPAHIGFGGWNSCPSDACLVAALRSWRDRYAAELVCISDNSLELQLQSHLSDLNSAVQLTKELILVAPDLVDGAINVRSIARDLMGTKWVYLWWD